MLLLLVVVRAAEKLADAHVVCLRGGGWVSSTEGSVRRCWPAGAAIYLLQTDSSFHHLNAVSVLRRVYRISTKEHVKMHKYDSVYTHLRRGICDLRHSVI